MANTTQILVRNPAGVLTSHGDIHKIQHLTFSLNVYSETRTLDFVVFRNLIKGGEKPPRSPDLSLLDFCLWGYLKSKVYSPLPATLNQLQANITREVTQLDPAMMRRATLDFRSRAASASQQGVATLKSRPVITHF